MANQEVVSALLAAAGVLLTEHLLGYEGRDIKKIN